MTQVTLTYHLNKYPPSETEFIELILDRDSDISPKPQMSYFLLIRPGVTNRLNSLNLFTPQRSKTNMH